MSAHCPNVLRMHEGGTERILRKVGGFLGSALAGAVESVGSVSCLSSTEELCCDFGRLSVGESTDIRRNQNCGIE